MYYRNGMIKQSNLYGQAIVDILWLNIIDLKGR